MKNRDFIIFGEDFARHPHALEHLMRPLFASNRFIWVETIGLRSPHFSLYDLRRIGEKIKGWIFNRKTQKRNPEHIHVVSPFMIPLNQFKIVRKFNQWSVLRSVRKVAEQLQFKDIISISSVPNAADYVGHFNEVTKIYYCVDEFSLWPGLNYDLVSSLEKKLLTKVDFITATSDQLSQSKVLKDKTTTTITHGVDFEHFSIPEKTTLSKVKICYFGLFDERSDQDIILKMALDHQDCEIHLFGNVVCPVSKLEKCQNITFHGSVSYAELPAKIIDMDIFFLPYTETDLTRFINPLKLKEYLCTGRPVVATPLPEVIKLKEYLSIATTPDDFSAFINLYKNKSRSFDRMKILNYIKQNETWQVKSQMMVKLIEDFERSRQSK